MARCFFEKDAKIFFCVMGARMEHTALLVVDVQPDFCPGGKLPVIGGDQIIPRINLLAKRYPIIVLTQDWHPADHSCFISQHTDSKIYSTFEAEYGPQIIWPDHCVIDTPGAAIHPKLTIDHIAKIQHKGSRREVDSYSAFIEADRVSHTGLDEWLRGQGITELHLCGLATDFCVAWSALDAKRLGYDVTLLLHACRAINLHGSLDRALAEMRAAGVHIA
jgi:nicotinamidase/pyrazinamidase